MDREFAERLGELAREAGVSLSVHAPLFAFVGRPERDRKHRMAVGMLDHTSGLAMACGAEVVVIHPGYLFGREREQAVDAVVEQLAELRERLEGKGRDVAFGMEVMGRVNELGSLEDVLSICSRLDWVRPVLDFAHLHAVSDGGYTEAEPFREALTAADGTIEAGAPFHIHFSDIDFANRNEKSHLPYGEERFAPIRSPRPLRGSSGRPRSSASRPTRSRTRRSARCSRRRASALVNVQPSAL